MNHPSSVVIRVTWACVAACFLTASARPAQVESVASVFDYPNTDPYDRNNLYGFNHAPNVATLPDGRLLASWFTGAHEGDIHQLILGATSRDGGRSWSPAAPLVDLPRKSDFDPAFAVKGSTAWMLFAAGRWNRYPWVGLRDAEKREIGADSFRLHLMATEDSGRTWSEPIIPVARRGFCRGNGIVLRNGAILFPVYDQGEKSSWRTSILRSVDNGKSWQWVGQLVAAEGSAGGEPVIVELNNGDVLAALRSRDGRIWFARSPDAGDTWGVPYASDFDAAASSHSLYRTKAGRVFLIYNACKPPHRTPLGMRELDQKTMLWGEMLEIARAPEPGPEVWSSQVSYPSITETLDSLVVVWTEISLAPLAQSGKIRAARIKL